MAVAISRADAVLELAVAFAEPSVAIAIGMRRPIFLPEQHQRHALALHLRGHLRPVGFAQIPGRAADTLEKDLLQRRIVIATRWQRPAVQTGLPGAVQVGRHGRLAELQTQSNLAHRKPLFMRQPQYGSYVLHSHAPRLLASWHVPSRSCSRPAECRDGAGDDQPYPRPREVSGNYRNPCPGFTETRVRELAKPASAPYLG